MSTETQCSWCAVESGNLRPGSHGICERHKREMLGDLAWAGPFQAAQAGKTIAATEAAIAEYRVNTPKDDLNEPLSLSVGDGKRESSLRFSLRVALACAFLGAILWTGWILGCVIAFLTKGQ